MNRFDFLFWHLNLSHLFRSKAILAWWVGYAGSCPTIPYLFVGQLVEGLFYYGALFKNGDMTAKRKGSTTLNGLGTLEEKVLADIDLIIYGSFIVKLLLLHTKLERIR